MEERLQKDIAPLAAVSPAGRQRSGSAKAG